MTNVSSLFGNLKKKNSLSQYNSNSLENSIGNIYWLLNNFIIFFSQIKNNCLFIKITIYNLYAALYNN